MSPKQALKSLSIKKKLMLIMMATSGAAIFLMALFIVMHQAINSQRGIRQQLSTLAEMLGSRSSAALTFDDSATGSEILKALALKSNIVYAVIERPNGVPFATFEGGAMAAPPAEFSAMAATERPANFWSDLFSNEIQVSHGIYLENEQIGTIRIVSTLDELHHDLRNYTLLVILMTVICFGVTVYICTRLQKIISEPILRMQMAMDSVSEDKDYSLRVFNTEANELGALINGFNHMLEQIQMRDDQLAEYSTHLETIVAARTQQLTDANQKRILWLETMARFLKHELKNASVGIKTSLDLIERRAKENKSVDVYLARARKSMDNMNALLQSAGDASNLEASLYKDEHERLNLGAVVKTHMESYASIYPTVLMKMDCRSGIAIFGNEIRLQQLLDKLISNAVEHFDHASPIEVSVDMQPEVARLVVANHGDALPENKAAIFDLFVSLKTMERKTADEHYGLGLYIVKLIAESHGGQVAARDLQNGTGALFEVTFPLVRPNKN